MIAVAPETEARLLSAFRRAASQVPAYRSLLHEQGVIAEQVVDAASFSRLCPLTTKANTFDRFTIEEMCVAGGLRDLAGVLTSSGHGGRFSFGLITTADASAGADFIDAALDEAFQVRECRTLAINCLPMGVGFSSRVVTMATTSVREDMAVALVRTFGGLYDQIIVVGDPLFLKIFTDRAAREGVDWSRHRVNLVIGEEIFGECYRDYLSVCLGHDPGCPGNGYIMSSFGVGELGLHLCYETPATIALRRAALSDQAFAHDALGTGGAGAPLPMIFTFNPLRTFIEIADPDEHGYGRMTISMLDAGMPLPLLRYQTGDIARVLDAADIARAANRHAADLRPDLPRHILALKGRDKDVLPNGFHVGVYKDALYGDHTIARRLSGAFRLLFSGSACTMHVQLIGGEMPDPGMEQALLDLMPEGGRPASLVLWIYERFPFGMGLDYERKFTHYLPGETI